MISAPGIGCCSSSLASKASAGGQLEQPSDVNNSQTTGTRTPASGAALAAPLSPPPPGAGAKQNITDNPRAHITIPKPLALAHPRRLRRWQRLEVPIGGQRAQSK